MNEAVIAAVAAALTAMLTVGVTAAISWRKASREGQQADHEYLFTRYRQMFEAISDEMEQLKLEMHALTEQHISCISENAALKERVAHLEAEVERLKEAP